MQRFFFAIAVVSAVTFGSLPAARACTCAERSFEELAAGADAIFEARVASIEPGTDGMLRIGLDVVQTWREANTEHVEVLTQALSSACGYTFEVGRSYLVLASRREDRLVVSLCGGTRPMEDASDERVALGSGVIPVDVEDEPAEQDEGRPPQAVQRRGGGCAGCSVGSDGAGMPGALAAMLATMLAIVVRRRGFR